MHSLGTREEGFQMYAKDNPRARVHLRECTEENNETCAHEKDKDLHVCDAPSEKARSLTK
jgi:hypothetical protein